MLPQIHQGVMNSWNILKFHKEEEIVKYSNGWSPLSSKPQFKKIKEYLAKKREANKAEAPSKHTSPRREEEQEKELEKTIIPKLKDSKNPKRCHGQFLQHCQNLDRIQGHEGTKNERTSLPKEKPLSQDAVNTLKEIKNSILPLKEIKNSLLSLREMNNNLSPLTKIVLQKKRN
ncbi:hypothetical protein O181_132830 [Austropuccinia psidii MF-1]|uniref:Uncharacterized protein n=1 Tax=Austropuccinia psidii MF-1 TaxID=1389203 RepID=A0A9Q3L3J2_9BASI|nr:hypothetical protein [Austropuccinia psidii MF-1]